MAEEKQSDLDLLEAWRGGDQPAGNTLFERHFRSIYRFFRSKVDDATAEDLAQATFMACVDGRDRFRQHSSFRTYAYAIARNQLYMHLRKRGRQDKVMEFDTVSAADLEPGPRTLVAAKQEQQLLMRALRRIPLEFQIVVELYYWEGLRTPDLARILDVPEGTVRSRLTRARDHLGKQIKALAADAALAESTVAGFDTWAASLKAALDA
ncbi:MAG: RNA polymerase sigma factor [Myxococcota bacterium]